MLKKNQAIYKLYSEDIAIAKQDYFLAITTIDMPSDFGKMPKYAQAAKTKVTVPWFVKCTN
jgi:Cu(I)/Ag(I) efflux system membrane fusion protein